ncbi:MAG: 3-phosphoshikimate 1-carboxyvinyltransferase [Bacteroidota bacterium]
MKRNIYPGNYSGQIRIPPSKSYLQRAIAIAALGKGISVIKGYVSNNDVDTAIRIIQNLGAETIISENEIQIKGIEESKQIVHLECGEAGLSVRMFSAIASLKCNEVYMKGSGSLLNRPMKMVSDALEQLGLRVRSCDGKLPLQIEGKLEAGRVYIDGSESSQLLSGLLIALTQVNGSSTILVENVRSIPYIRMTIKLMQHFGLSVTQEGFEKFEIKGGQSVLPTEYEAEGDWSSASTHLVGAAISGTITIHNLKADSVQADAVILNVLKSCGADVIIDGDTISVHKNKLQPFIVDITHCPDLFPALCVLAANCKGTSHISGIHRLANKESNRLVSIQNEFKKLGITVLTIGDQVSISGGEINGGDVNSHNDHRIVMAMATMALNATGPVSILGVEAVHKSYPSFFQDFEHLSHKSCYPISLNQT